MKLLNESHEPLLTWHIVDAFPTKWPVSDLNSTANTVVIDAAARYQYLTVERS